MLTYRSIGPYEDGSYLVVYPMPGCSILTAACDCRTKAQADGEAERLNVVQMARERAIKIEHALCGLYRIRSGAYI